MGEKKPEPLDFVKDFQEYLTQQTHHVNMISGSVSGDKEAETLQGGRLILILSKFTLVNVSVLVHGSPFMGITIYQSGAFFSFPERHRRPFLPSFNRVLLWDNDLM